MDMSLRKQAGLLQFTALMVVIAAVLNYLRLGGVFPALFATFEALRFGEMSLASEEINGFLRGLVLALPTFCYLAAVWVARGIFSRVGKGEIFSVANSKALGAIGGDVMLAGASAIVVVPVLLDLLDGGNGFVFHAEAQDMLLIVIGGLIQMLGVLMARAGGLKSELDQII